MYVWSLFWLVLWTNYTYIMGLQKTWIIPMKMLFMQIHCRHGQQITSKVSTLIIKSVAEKWFNGQVFGLKVILWPSLFVWKWFNGKLHLFERDLQTKFTCMKVIYWPSLLICKWFIDWVLVLVQQGLVRHSRNCSMHQIYHPALATSFHIFILL